MERIDRGLDCGDGRCHDMFWEFVYIVVIPGGVVFFIVFITSIILCCGSCKRLVVSTHITPNNMIVIPKSSYIQNFRC